MKRALTGVVLCTLAVTLRSGLPGLTTLSAQRGANWPQWGQNPQHTGTINVVGQSIDQKLADIVYDAFVPDEQAFTGGALDAHYQVPILDGQDVFMEFKTGSFPQSADDPFQFEIWHEKRLHWQDGRLEEKWDFQSDWKSLPFFYVGGWEPVFHGVLANDFIYVPGLRRASAISARALASIRQRTGPETVTSLTVLFFADRPARRERALWRVHALQHRTGAPRQVQCLDRQGHGLFRFWLGHDAGGVLARWHLFHCDQGQPLSTRQSWMGTGRCTSRAKMGTRM